MPPCDNCLINTSSQWEVQCNLWKVILDRCLSTIPKLKIQEVQHIQILRNSGECSSTKFRNSIPVTDSNMETINHCDEVPTQKGQYNYKLKGFSGLYKKPGDFIPSPRFALCGEIWQLVLFPAGIEQKSDRFYFELRCESDTAIRAIVVPSLIDITKRPKQLWQHIQDRIIIFAPGQQLTTRLLALHKT